MIRLEPIKDRIEQMTKRADIPEDAAKICFSNDLYKVYRPDGFYAKEVWTARTLFGAEEFCRKNGWRIIK